MGSILLSCWLITLHVAVLMLKTMLINVIFGCFAGPERTQEEVAVFTFKALHRSRLPSAQFIHIQERHRKHDPIPSELQSPVFPTDWDHRGVRHPEAALNESHFYFTAPRLTTQYFTKALRRRGLGFLKHEIDMQETRWGFSISEAQRCVSVYNAKSLFIANFAINHQNSTLNQTEWDSIGGIKNYNSVFVNANSIYIAFCKLCFVLGSDYIIVLYKCYLRPTAIFLDVHENAVPCYQHMKTQPPHHHVFDECKKWVTSMPNSNVRFYKEDVTAGGVHISLELISGEYVLLQKHVETKNQTCIQMKCDCKKKLKLLHWYWTVFT